MTTLITCGETITKHIWDTGLRPICCGSAILGKNQEAKRAARDSNLRGGGGVIVELCTLVPPSFLLCHDTDRG
jgi:hypothetical protein